MDGLPVTVRLLDPPLHEFLPDHEELIVKEATRRDHRRRSASCCAAAALWRESNPMLGTRGCRLGILKPGLYRMQVRALMQAAVDAQAGGRRSDRRDHDPADRHASPSSRCSSSGCARRPTRCSRDAGVDLDYLVGTMIETPRAALVADDIAEVAEFFSFGTNDLTQMTFGFSRDDIEGRFMSEYLEHKLLPREPVRDARRRGCRPARAHGLSSAAARRGADLKLGICGEHGGDPDVGRVLPRGRARLRVVLAVPRADRPARGRARGARASAARAPPREPSNGSRMRYLRTDSIHRWTEGDYTVTTDPRASWTSTWCTASVVEEAYWWHGRSRDVIEHGVANSRPCSLLARPLGHAGRLRTCVTDGVWFAWLGDVMVVREHRGGHGTFLCVA